MFGSRRVLAIVAAALVLAAACGGSASPAPPAAAPTLAPPSAVSSILASGPLAAIPTGALFVNGGNARSSAWVPDLDFSWDLSPRNLNVER